jgi:hypothetical protein
MGSSLIGVRAPADPRLVSPPTSKFVHETEWSWVEEEPSGDANGVVELWCCLSWWSLLFLMSVCALKFVNDDSTWDGEGKIYIFLETFTEDLWIFDHEFFKKKFFSLWPWHYSILRQRLTFSKSLTTIPQLFGNELLQILDNQLSQIWKLTFQVLVRWNFAKLCSTILNSMTMIRFSSLWPWKFSCLWYSFDYYPQITYYWTVSLILDQSYLVGKLTRSKIADTKVSGFYSF